MINSLLQLSDGWQLLLFLGSLFMFFGVGYIIIRENGRPSKTIAWLMVIIVFPFIGVLLYLQFGLNFRRRKMFRLKKSNDVDRYHKIIDQEYYDFEQETWINRPEVKEHKLLAKLLLKGSKSLFTDYNEVEVLTDGKETFESIFKALESARKFIHIQFYILEEGDLAERLLDILGRKVKEGVQVRLLYDAVGSWSLSKDYKSKLTKIGVEHHEFMPVRFAMLGNRVNYRNHRKIIVIDTKIGFTGGINIADKYIKGNHLGHWRDTFVRIEGNAANGLQFLFLSDWYFASGNDLIERKNFFLSDKQSANGCPVQIVGSGPDSDYAGIHQEYTSLISSAKEYVFISNPYLIPGEIIVNALINAAMGGVDVRVMIPGISDYKIVRWSTNSYLERLLEAGVKIYHYHAGFLHAKVIVSDDEISSIGTANMDIRSFELNFEVNAVIYDKNTALSLKEQFQKDCESSIELDQQEFLRRPFSQKLMESISRLVSPLL